jgi:hypothetical protein
MPLKLVCGAEAAEMLSSQDFRSHWLQLYRACPWATAVQHPGFACSWYEVYEEQYAPVLMGEFSGANALTGLLVLAVDRSGAAIIPGGRQAEYKSWLALPQNGSQFISAALALLSREMKVGTLLFRYLPSSAPLDAILASTAPWTCELESFPRPVVRLGNAAEVAEYLAQKTNSTLRNSRNRLKKLGNIRLEQIRESEELAPVFDQLIQWYDARQEAAHGKRPFQTDKNKKEWHLRLLKEGLLHVTLMKVGQELVSALLRRWQDVLGDDARVCACLCAIFAHGAASPDARRAVAPGRIFGPGFDAGARCLQESICGCLRLGPGALDLFHTARMAQSEDSSASPRRRQASIIFTRNRTHIFDPVLAPYPIHLPAEESAENAHTARVDNPLPGLNAEQTGLVPGANSSKDPAPHHALRCLKNSTWRSRRFASSSVR